LCNLWLCSEVKFVVGDAAKLPAILKALKGFNGSLKGITYWGKAAPEAIKVGNILLLVLLLLLLC
jgi:hypothetical protein